MTGFLTLNKTDRSLYVSEQHLLMLENRTYYILDRLDENPQFEVIGDPDVRVTFPLHRFGKKIVFYCSDPTIVWYST